MRVWLVEQGNFAEVVFSVIEPRTKRRAELPGPPITIRQLNDLLDRLAAADSTGEKTKVMHEIIQQTTAREQRWILRVILKDMQLGMKEDSVFKLLHPDAKELYASVCDLRATCEQCVDPTYRCVRRCPHVAIQPHPSVRHETALLVRRLNEISFCLFRALQPRHAHRADWRQVHKILSKKGEYAAEYKLDGERLMLHFERGARPDGSDRAEWFTRNCKNFTGWYGEAMGTTLRECLRPGLRDCILDGEMMVWKTDTGEFAAFGENRSLGDYRRRLDEGFQPCYVVFDALWINGESLGGLPLRERRERMRAMIDWKKHSMELSEMQLVEPNRDGRDGSREASKTHTEEIMMCLDRAMAKGYEGIVFKSLEAAYAPGARDHDWMKLKPDYVDEMGESLDLIILAGYYGDGKRRGGTISHFLLGLRAPEHERHKWGTQTDQALFYPFCKCGTGYSAQRLESLRAELLPGQRPWRKTARPAHLCGWVPVKTDDEPDVWFEPAKSLLMAVKAYEIVRGDSFLGGFTLRFPRCVGIRSSSDKPWHACEEYATVQQRFRDGNAKVAANKRKAADVAQDADADTDASTRGKKTHKGGGASSRSVDVLGAYQFDRAALAAQAQTTDRPRIFADVVAIVRGFGALDASSDRHVNRLRSLIASLGGTVDANLTCLTTLIIDADDTPGALIQEDVAKAQRDRASTYDILAAQWVFDCSAAGAWLPIEPRYVRYASPETDAAMRATMDSWGDRYKEPATQTSLAEATALVRSERRRALRQHGQRQHPQQQQQQHALQLLHEEKLREAMRALPDDDVATLTAGPATCLLGVVGYAQRPATRLRLRIGGARTVDAPTAGVTHVVLPASAASDGSLASIRAAITRARVDAAAVDGGEGGVECGEGGVSACFVSESWLDACESRGARVEEAEHRMAMR